MTIIGDELKRLRLKKGLTLDEVAKHTGITKQYLSMLENGQRKAISFEIMINISNFFNVPIEYFKRLFKEEEEPRILTKEELEIWQLINEKVNEEIYFKNKSKKI